DQLLHIEDVAVGRVLHAGAGPQQALHLGSLRSQLFPARTGKLPFVALIGELGVGDCDFAAKLSKYLPLTGRKLIGSRVDELVDSGIDATDKETGNAGDLTRVTAPGNHAFEPGQVGFDNFAVDLL